MIFSVSQTNSDAGIDFLIKIAKSGESTEARKQAIFWLGQSNNSRAREALLDILNQ